MPVIFSTGKYQMAARNENEDVVGIFYYKEDSHPGENLKKGRKIY